MKRKYVNLEKTISRRNFLKTAGVGLGTALAFPGFSKFALGASKWPDRPINLVIAYSGGGGVDTLSRATAKAMEEIAGWTINCNNMGGSQGALASRYVFSKPSAAYWWLGTGGYNRSSRVLGYTKRRGWIDWQHYTSATSIQGWAVRTDSPIKDFGDLIEYARKKPNEMIVSQAGIGGIWHLGSILVQKATGTKWVPLPFKGGAPATLALLQGECVACGNGIHEQVEFLRAGKLRNLAIFADKPLKVEGVGVLRPVTDYVPGVKPFTPWGSLYNITLRRDVPVEILKKIKEVFLSAMDDQDFNDILKKRVLFRDPKVGAEADKESAKHEAIVAWGLWDAKAPSAKVNPKDLGIPRPEEFEAWWPPADYKPRI